MEFDLIFCSQECIQLRQFWKSLGCHFFCPIIRSCDHLRFGCEECGKLYIAGPHSHQATVFTRTSTLHRRTHHDRRDGDRNPRLNGSQDHGLRASAAGPSHCQSTAVHIRQALQKVGSTNGVPRLEPHHTLQSPLGLRAEQSPSGLRIHFRALLSEPMRHVITDLLTVRVANHVIVKDDAPHAGQLNTTGLQWATATLHKPLSTANKVLVYLIQTGIVKPPITPMPMR